MCVCVGVVWYVCVGVRLSQLRVAMSYHVARQQCDALSSFLKFKP